MRFGIFYEHQLPRPWSPGAERRLIEEALEQVELADRIGIDYVWVVEHHFLEEYSHSSASDVFLAAASQRTRDIRLGLGILPLPPGFQHPARVAETAATLDLVSGGRVELGTGETSSGAELGGFGVDRATKRAQWDEALDVVTRMMVEEPFAGWEGNYLSMPPRNVIPKPVQKPHPPLWVACSRRETIRTAAAKGLGVLSFAFVEPEEAAQWVDEYHAILASEQCVPGGFAVNPRFAVVLPMMVHEDERTAIERGVDGAHFFGYSLAHYYVYGEHRPGRTDVYAEFQARREERGFARGLVRPDQRPLGVKLLEQGLGSLRGALGTPGQVRDLIARYEAAGVDQVIFVMQAGRTRHEHICEALELFGREVLPDFAARAAEADAAVDAGLADAVAAALARRPPARASDIDHVVHAGSGGPRTREQRPAGIGARLRWLGPALRGGLVQGGKRAFVTLVRRGDERLLERVFGSPRGLRALFAAMTARFVPERARDFNGEIQYDLRTVAGTRSWTITIADGRAQARAGAAAAPQLTIKLTLADLLRMAAGELDPGEALMTGRLDLAGDFLLATRMGEMFGQPSAF